MVSLKITFTFYTFSRCVCGSTVPLHNIFSFGSVPHQLTGISPQIQKGTRGFHSLRCRLIKVHSLGTCRVCCTNKGLKLVSRSLICETARQDRLIRMDYQIFYLPSTYSHCPQLVDLQRLTARWLLNEKQNRKETLCCFLITEASNMGAKTVGHISFNWPASPKFARKMPDFGLAFGCGFL